MFVMSILLTYGEVDKYLLGQGNCIKVYPFEKGAAVYKVGGKMFALMDENKSPVNLSLKCDPLLAETLRNRYESVSPGHQLNKRHWITIVLSGQLSWEQIQDLIRHSYLLVSDSK